MGRLPRRNPFPAVYDTNARYTPFGGYTVMPHTPGSVSGSELESVAPAPAGQRLHRFRQLSRQPRGPHAMTAPLNPGIYFPGNADASGRCFAQGYTFTTTPNAVCSANNNVDSRRILSLVTSRKTGRLVGALAEYQSVRLR